MAKDIVFFCCTHKGRIFTDYEYFILGQAEKPVRFSFTRKSFIGGLAFSILTPWKKIKEKNFLKISQNVPFQDL